MVAEIESFNREIEASQVIAALHRDGAAIVRDVIAHETMDHLLGLVAPNLETSEARADTRVFIGNADKYVKNLIGHAS